MKDTIGNSFKAYRDNLIKSLMEVDTSMVESFVGELVAISQVESHLYILGNGGSAATASHFANDLFSLSYHFPQFKLRASSLSDNSSIITAIANDLSFEEVYLAQLKPTFKKGDSILLISASGNSPNLVSAAKWVKEQGGRVFSLIGFDGGALKEISDFSIHFVSEKGEYERCEDLHLFINHFLRHYLQQSLAS